MQQTEQNVTVKMNLVLKFKLLLYTLLYTHY